MSTRKKWGTIRYFRRRIEQLYSVQNHSRLQKIHCFYSRDSVQKWQIFSVKRIGNVQNPRTILNMFSVPLFTHLLQW